VNSIKDKVLFIDARNYYTKVDQTLNEWSEWQLKNLNAIAWLYRGEKEKYKALLEEYKKILGNDKSFEVHINEISKKLQKLRLEAKKSVESSKIREKKKVQRDYDDKILELTDFLSIAKEANWLYEKFGEGIYTDVLGLCKTASINEIEEKGWTLTPGAYVGVVAIEDDGVNFEERMEEIHRELLSLQAESNELMDIISQNIKEIARWEK